MNLVGKVAIVTGGSRGIGRIIALALAQAGADIAIAARNKSELEKTSAEIRRLGRSCIDVQTDVGQWLEVVALMDQTEATFGKVDILVNCAGIQGPIGFVTDNQVVEWVESVRMNLGGVFLCTRAVLPRMLRRREGKIINISGGGAALPRERFSAYSAAKAAIVCLTEVVAEEVKNSNIQVNAIAPGVVNTRMQDQILAAGEAAGVKAADDARKCRETGGSPSDKFVELAVFLASDASRGITGKLISALHDTWSDWPSRIPELSSTPSYTLRRVDPLTLQSVAGKWPFS